MGFVAKAMPCTRSVRDVRRLGYSSALDEERGSPCPGAVVLPAVLPNRKAQDGTKRH